MRRSLRVRLTLACASLCLVAAGGGAAEAQAQAPSPVPAPPEVIDGPSANVIGLSGASVARDGTGGVVYLKSSGGTAHVFLSRLAGSFQNPQRIDAGLSGASSQPVIAAGNGGLLIVAFINGGQLYVSTQASSGAGFSAPRALAAGASNPAIAITNLGKAYLAFTADGGGGHDVRCAYYYQGNWGLESAPLDAAAADDAGTGAGRPAVTASGDGVGILAWGENGHIYSRRVWATSPSIVYEQADPPSMGGYNEVASSHPALGTGGDSSYAAVAFQETFSNGSQQQSRVLMQQLRGSAYTGVAQPDGLGTPGADGADQPQVAVGEYGAGFVTSERIGTHQLIAMRLTNNDAPNSVFQLDSLPNAAAPYAVPTAVGYRSDLIAWQETPALATPQIRARFFDGSAFDSEQVLSSPSMGPTDEAAGLAADGDILADVVVAWVQGSPGSQRIVVSQLYQPPGSFPSLPRLAYARSAQPTLTWSPPRENWGPLRYTVSLNGAQIARTTATAVQVPTPLTQGGHRWQVSATNPAGLTVTSPQLTVFVDTIKPKVKAKLLGSRTVGARLELRVSYRDAVGVPRADASGVAKVRVKWGDGTRSRIHHHGYHAYSSAGRYRITVTVTDRAGNRRKVQLVLDIRRKGRHGH